MKRSFLTGLVILLPLALTFFLLSLVLDIFTAPFLDLVKDFLTKHDKIFIFFKYPIFITFVAKVIIISLFLLTILFLGIIGRWFLFKTILHWGNILFMKIPVIKSIYHTTKDIVTSIFSIDERKAFLKPLMVEFPSEKSYCIGFLSGSVPPQCQKPIEKKLTSVFIPTAPHPISGYMVFATDETLKDITMTNEEAIKFTVSCGVIVPTKEEKKQ